MRKNLSATCQRYPSAFYTYHSRLGGAPPWWVDMLSAHAPRCRIATPEGFLSAQGPPGSLTHKPILVLCHGHKEVSTLPSFLFSLSPGHLLHTLSSFVVPLLDLYRNYLWFLPDLQWFVAESYTTPPRRPPLRPTPLLRRTMYLHETITTGDTKRWTRSVGLRVFTRSLQNHT